MVHLFAVKKTKIEALLSEYLKLKDALVADNLQLSKKEITAIKTKVEEINTIGLKGEAEKVWKMVNIQLINRTKELSEAKDLKEIPETNGIPSRLLNDDVRSETFGILLRVLDFKQELELECVV